MAIEAPFVGLSPFDARYRDYFFGRQSESTILAANILSARICVVFGRSGVGKTSVMQAGVPGALDEFEQTTYLCLRAWQEDPHHAFLRLLRTAADAAGGAATGIPEASAAAIAFDIVRTSRKPLVLVFDQFEEFYQSANAASRTRFEVELSTIVSAIDCDVHVALSIRDDALYRLDSLKGLIPEVMSRMIEVRGLSVEAAAEAIRNPVAKFNEEHTTDYRVDDDLVDVLLSQVVSKPRFRRPSGDADTQFDKRTIEAPFLQLALKVLWDNMIGRRQKRLSRSLLDDLGGVEEIVARHLEVVIKSAKGDESYLAVIFDRLITPEGHKIALSLDDLESFVAGSTEQGELPAYEKSRVEALLTKLATGDERILRITEGGRYELFHDILAQPIIEWVRRFNQLERNRRQRRRHVSGSVAVALVVAVLAGLYWFQDYRRDTIAEALAGAAVAELDRGNQVGAVLAAEKILELMPSAKKQTVIDKVLRALWSGLIQMRFDGRVFNVGDGCDKDWKIGAEPRSHNGWVYGVDFSPDESLVVTGGGDNFARVWNVETFKCVCQLKGQRGISDVAFSPLDSATPNVIATASFDGTARLWDVGSWHEGRCPEIGQLSGDGVSKAHEEAVLSIAFSNDGSRVVTGSQDGTASIWETATRRSIAILASEPNPEKLQKDWIGHTAAILSVAFSSADNTIVATASSDHTARIWDISDLLAVKSWALLGHGDAVSSVAFSPDGKEVATSSFDDTVRVWDTAARTMIRGPLNAQKRSNFLRVVYGKKNDPTSKNPWSLVTGGEDHSVLVWTADSFQQIAELLGHTQPVLDLALSPSGRWIVSGSADGTARLWDLESLRGATPYQNVCPVTSIAASPPGKGDLFATGSEDGVVRVWQLGRNDPGQALIPYALEDQAVARTKRASAACDDPNPVKRVIMDPEGKMLFAAYANGRVIAWDLPSGPFRWSYEPDFQDGACPGKAEVNVEVESLGIAFLANRRELVLALHEKQKGINRSILVRIDAQNGQASGGPYCAKNFFIDDIATNPEGTLLAIAGMCTARTQRTTLVQLVESDGSPGEVGEEACPNPGEPPWIDTGGLHRVKRLAFSSDGRQLAGVAELKTVVWVLPPHGKTVPLVTRVFDEKLWDFKDAAFDSTGRFLFTTSEGGTIRVWGIDSEEEVYDYAPHYGAVNAVAISGDGETILTGGDDTFTVAVENLADTGRACRVWHEWKETTEGVWRNTLNDHEVDRIMNAVAPANFEWLDILSVVKRDELAGEVCPK